MRGLESLKEQFNGHVAFRERRPGLLQVLAPLFHEDGDRVDIFLDEPANGSDKIRVGDHGLTSMRLTYSYDLDTENKERIFRRIRSENRIQEQDGRLFIDADPDRLSFLHSVRVVQRRTARFAAIPRWAAETLHEAILQEILQERVTSSRIAQAATHALHRRLPADQDC